MRPTDEDAVALQKFLFENYGEMDVTVGVGKEYYHVYVMRGKKHMKVIPREWEGVTVKKHWTGKVGPAV